MAAGIAFVGPTPEQLRVFGLKHTARALAREQGVPMLEGTDLLDSPQPPWPRPNRSAIR